MPGSLRCASTVWGAFFATASTVRPTSPTLKQKVAFRRIECFMVSVVLALSKVGLSPPRTRPLSNKKTKQNNTHTLLVKSFSKYSLELNANIFYCRLNDCTCSPHLRADESSLNRNFNNTRCACLLEWNVYMFELELQAVDQDRDTVNENQGK